MSELVVSNLDQQTRDLQLAVIDNDSSKLKVIANLLGYKQMPVPIDQFLDDPYYMGNISKELYPFWRDQLKLIFPDPIHTAYPYIAITGAIGTGKSTVSRFAAEYVKHRICCLRDPYETFHFVRGKNIKMSFFHRTSTLAQTDFLGVLNDWEEHSPYFQEMYKSGSNLQYIEQVADSTRTNTGIGSDVLFYTLSELNFIDYESAHVRLDMAIKRLNSRFERIRHYFGMIIIDTSSQGDESIAETFVKENPFGDDVLTIRTNKWKVREHMHYYFQKGSFKVFCGDSTHQPFIIKPEAGKILTADMDPDRVLIAPEECRPSAEFDLITFLQDEAGVSTSSSDRFFSDVTNLKKCFHLPQYGPDVHKFDFFDKTDKLIYRFSRSLQDIPTDRIIYIRFDLGVVNDYTGLAIAYFDKWGVYDKDKNVKFPHINVPLAVGISRNEGEETSLEHMYEFILDLNDKFEIGDVSFDQFQSRMILQNLSRSGIKNRYLSVDRTDEAYVYCKNLANSGYLHLPANSRLEREFCELRRIGNKIDHPSVSSTGDKGSKDISDAVAGCVFDLFGDIDHAGQLSNKYKVNSFSKSMEERAKQIDNAFQDMINNIYGGGY